MAYDVDTWKTKELVDLRIPVASLYVHERKDWHPERTDVDGCATFTIGEGTKIVGRVVAGIIMVDEIESHGEGSGTALRWIIVPALEQSIGKLVATRVWEGGDSIDRLTVKNGVVTREELKF